VPRVTGQSDHEFYSGLARRLREANRVGSERARPFQEKQIAEGGVPLADMLDLLTSSDGAQLISALEKESESAVAELNANLAKHGQRSTIGASLETGIPHDAFYPKDPFRKRLAEFFEDREFFSEPKHDKEAVAAAVVKTFSVLTGPTGVVTKETAGKLGPRALAVFEAMRKRLDEVGGTPKSDRKASKIEDLLINDLARIGRSRRVGDAKARMPVLDEVTRMIGGPDMLRGFTMASVQHLFPSTRGLYKALADNGLEHATTGVGGKGYSTDVDTMMRLAAEGFDVHMDGRPMAHANATNAEEVVLEMAREELGQLFVGLSREEAKGETKPRFLLLDEGAKLIKALHLYYPQYAHLCVCVEQTDRGVQIIEAAKAKRAEERAAFEATGVWPKPREGFELRCAVVNMARSEAKKQWESPMIGESCVFNLEQQLAEIHPQLDAKLFPPGTKREACVIGYGAVGKAVADQLRLRGYEVHVYDKDPAKMAQAAADGCVAEARDEALKHGKLLYGCTGQTILRPADYDLLPDGAVLANAASGNHELGLHDVNLDALTHDDATFRGLDVKLGERADPMRHRVMKTPGGKELLLARSGYVVNMGLDLPPEYAQLTRSLLLASCLTAVKNGGAKGFVEIPQDVQKLIVERVRHHLEKQGMSLKEPDFRDLQPWG
jgi:S-adenosylhomocysteine hydrolase